jgi:hypothetical protein
MLAAWQLPPFGGHGRQPVMSGFDLATPQEARAGRKPMLVVWIAITAQGRKAIG